jgi:membrane-associated protein
VWVVVNTAAAHQALADTLAVNPLNAKDLLALGLFAVVAVLFAETGLLVGFFFPGDSLLFLAGVATSPVADQIVHTHMSLWQLMILAPIGAIAGAQLGYLLGARYGARLFNRPDSRLFKREYVDKAESYFQKFGPAKAVVLARFIPIVRTFLNPVAGVLEMPARSFLLWNVIGGVLWTDGVLLVGHYLAQNVIKVIPAEKIDAYLLPVAVLIVLISSTPIFVEIYRHRRDAKRARTADSS